MLMVELASEPRTTAALLGGLLLAICFVYKQHRKREQARNSPHTIRVTFPEPMQEEDEDKVTGVVQQGIEYFTANARRSTVVGAGGLMIHYAELAPQTGKETCTIFFLPGWAECMIKYGDFFQELVEQHSCRVVVLDHRSQGYSERENLTKSKAENDHLKSHILDFHDHVTDALLVLNATIDLQNTKLFIMGFSLGGLIATELNKLVPSSGLVLIAPCFHPPIPVLPRVVARWLARKLEREAFVRGHPTYPDYKMDYPPLNRGTNSLGRIKCWEELRRTEQNILVTGMSWSQLHALLTPEGNAPTNAC